MKPINVLSLFNGLSCGRIALERAGIPVANYYESEIDKYANIVSAYNWPESVQIGDVRNVVVSELSFVPDLLIAGSPCQGFSFAGKQLNFNDPRSALFFEFVRILKECWAVNPNVLFMLENVPMKKQFQRVINEALGVYPVEINGALVSAQSRNRLFWSNIRTKTVGLFGDVYTDIPQPKDKGILLADVLEREVDEKYFLSARRLAIMMARRGKYTQLDGEKSMTFTTRSNAGWQGEMLSVKIDVNGRSKANQLKADCFTAGANTAGNHSQMDLIVQIPRGNNKGSERALNGKTSCISANRWEQNNHVRCVSMRGRHIDENENRADIKGADTVEIISNGGSYHQSDRVDMPEVKSRAIESHASGDFERKVLTGSRIRRLTPTEVCRLFTIPDNYFHDKNGKRLVSESQQYKALGNGWIVDVIAHIFSFIPMDTI